MRFEGPPGCTALPVIILSVGAGVQGLRGLNRSASQRLCGWLRAAVRPLPEVDAAPLCCSQTVALRVRRNMASVSAKHLVAAHETPPQRSVRTAFLCRSYFTTVFREK